MSINKPKDSFDLIDQNWDTIKATTDYIMWRKMWIRILDIWYPHANFTEEETTPVSRLVGGRVGNRVHDLIKNRILSLVWRLLR